MKVSDLGDFAIVLHAFCKELATEGIANQALVLNYDASQDRPEAPESDVDEQL